MKKFWRKFKQEDGQVMIIFAFAMVVLLGFAALVIDLGMVQVAKKKMQNAAEAAALAGAQDLPKVSDAISAAKSVAGVNGVSPTSIKIQVPYGGDPTQIEVVCTINVPYSFARIFGFTDTDVSGRAVARKVPQWAGEALPFLNLDDDYLANPQIVAWEKTAPGDFESLWDDEYEVFFGGKFDDHAKTYFTVDYADGIMVTKGTVATVKQEIGYIYGQKKPVYIFSLSSEVIKSGKYNDIKNKDVVPLKDLVLLQVTFDSFDDQAKNLYLTTTKVYDLSKGEYPQDYLSYPGGSSAILVD
jgi:hypothetical protein